MELAGVTQCHDRWVEVALEWNWTGGKAYSSMSFSDQTSWSELLGELTLSARCMYLLLFFLLMK